MVDVVTVVNYAAWYVFIYIAVVWLLVLFSNRNNLMTGRDIQKRLPKVSVIIPAYNEEKNIRRCIESVLSVKYSRRLLEVIVVNDCSGDATGGIARSFAPRGVRVLTNTRNRGKAYSLNRAIGASTGDIIACMDADSYVESDVLLKMVGHFEDERVGSVTPALKVWRPRNSLEKVQHVEYILNVFLRKILSFMESIPVTPGAFTLYRKSVLREVGGFDEQNLTEDMDIALKIQKNGYHIENVLDANAYTACPSSLGDLFRQRLRWYRGALYNSLKYKHMFFNRKYGNLGVFFLPMNLASILVVAVLFSVLVWSIVQNIAQSVWGMHLIGWDFSVFSFSALNLAFLGMITTPLVLGIMGMSIGGYVLLKSFRTSNISLKNNKIWYLIYLFYYPIIMMLFWVLAIVYETFRLKKRW